MNGYWAGGGRNVKICMKASAVVRGAIGAMLAASMPTSSLMVRPAVRGTEAVTGLAPGMITQ